MKNMNRSVFVGFVSSMLWAACGEKEGLPPEVFMDTAAISRVEKIDRKTDANVAPEQLPDRYTEGTFLKMEFGDPGDFMIVKTAEGKRKFFCAFLDHDHPLVDKEALYSNRRVKIGWKRSDVYDPLTDTFGKFDAVITLEWSGFTKTIGKGGDFATPELGFANLNQGDTLIFLPGKYKLPKGLEIWGKRNLFIKGADGGHVELIGESMHTHVLLVSNSEQIEMKNLTMRHVHPSQSKACTGSGIQLQHAYDIRIENCTIKKCGAIGIQMERCKNIRLTNNHIHHHSIGAASFDGQSILSEADAFPDLYFEGNTMKENGMEKDTISVTDSIFHEAFD